MQRRRDEEQKKFADRNPNSARDPNMSMNAGQPSRDPNMSMNGGQAPMGG
jgi:hypothetical protein